MKIFTGKPVRYKQTGTFEYAQGLAIGLEDVRANLPLNLLYRHTLDEFSFGYRSAYYERLRPAGKTLAPLLGNLQEAAA